jgi:hypothetical protein
MSWLDRGQAAVVAVQDIHMCDRHPWAESTATAVLICRMFADMLGFKS